MLASLFRNFLLAERIMKAYNCEPMSVPVLPPMHMHPFWQAWDTTLDLCFSKLPQILKSREPNAASQNKVSFFSEQSQAFMVRLCQIFIKHISLFVFLYHYYNYLNKRNSIKFIPSSLYLTDVVKIWPNQ